MREPRLCGDQSERKGPSPTLRRLRKQLLGSARSFLEPISAPAQVVLAFRNFFAGWLNRVVLFALVAFLPRPRFVVGFRFLGRIGGHATK